MFIYTLVCVLGSWFPLLEDMSWSPDSWISLKPHSYRIASQFSFFRMHASIWQQLKPLCNPTWIKHEIDLRCWQIFNYQIVGVTHHTLDVCLTTMASLFMWVWSCYLNSSPPLCREITHLFLAGWTICRNRGFFYWIHVYPNFCCKSFICTLHILVLLLPFSICYLM